VSVVVENNDDKPPAAGLDHNLEQIFGGMAQGEIERLTIEAIREYRASVAAAEAVRLARLAAEADPNCCAERLLDIQLRHQHAGNEYKAMQLVLNDLVDRLGYIPKTSAG
jgi:hypothetical protein